MKTFFLSRMLILLITTAFIEVTFSQAPVITSDMGIPTGPTSSRGVAYGNSVYVTILDKNLIYKSTDGNNWARVNDAGIPAGEFSSIAFGAGKFLIVGKNGLIISSDDGQTWTSRSSGTTQQLHNVQFLNGAFFIVGANATLRTSADGVSWAGLTPGSGVGTDQFVFITYGNSRFVITARNSGSGGGYVYTSSTGAAGSWSYQSLGFVNLNKIQHLKDRFFAFFSDYKVSTSSNGTSWTDVSAAMTQTLPDGNTVAWGSGNQIFNGIYDGTKFYFFGSGQYYGGYGTVWSSINGSALINETKSVYIVPQSSFYINGKYFQCGNEGIVSSADGVKYTYPTGNYWAAASNGAGYVAVGSVSSAGVIFTSPDFTTWTEKSPALLKPLYGVVYTGEKYIAAGDKTVQESTDDGNNWTQIATPSQTITCLAYGNNLLVAGGYASTGILMSSPNGTSWTVTNNQDNTYFKVKYINNQFFALGYNNTDYLGVIIHSTDGITWTDITPNLPFDVYYFSDVVYDGSKYHFMGTEFADPLNWVIDDFFSVSTATISDPNSFQNKGMILTPPEPNLGGDYGQGSFAYSNGRFVGSVNDAYTYNAYTIYSTDGINWTPVAVNSNSVQVNAVIAEGDKFRMIGLGDARISVDFSNLLLATGVTGFKATLMNGESLLQWHSSDNSTTSAFAVQHSRDMRLWTTIGKVARVPAINRNENYQFTDLNPLPGVNYYRVSDTDDAGRQQFTPVRAITIGALMDVHVKPNPVIDHVEVKLSSTHASVITVYNAAGIKVAQTQLNGNYVNIPFNRMASGVYTLVVVQNGRQFVKTLYHP